MFGSHSQRKPTFLWQGALILLPVAVMSAIGLLAIGRDKAAVEQEARQRAGELANQLASIVAIRVPAQLASYDLFSFTWLKHQLELATKEFPPRDDFALRLSEWQAANPGSHAEDVLPNRLSFKQPGIMVWPANFTQPPVAPDWFLGLTTEQRKAWEALIDSELTPDGQTNSDLKLREFFNCNPPPEGRASADFIWLRTRLAHQAGMNAVRTLQRAAEDYAGVRSESGLPLLSLVSAEALRLVRESGDAQGILQVVTRDKGNAFHQILTWIINEPSVLSPMLLAQLETLVGSHALEEGKFQPPIRAAQLVCASQERVHELAETLRRHWFLNNSVVTNFWLDNASGSWFCRAEPDRLTLSVRNSDDVLVRQTNDVISVRFYPRPALEHAFARAIQDLGVSIPDYFGVNVLLENKFLALDLTRDGHLSFGKVLAETRAQFSPLRVSSISDLPTAGQNGTAPEFEGSATGPQFAIQINLTNPQLLFARQRQRIWLFGGLILASVAAALVGLIAAYRSFRRQLRLSELKSNFVSSVSHEFRAPLASVRLMAESLERGKIHDSHKQQEYFHFIVQECRRLSSLIENVLDFSRIEQGRKQFEFEPTDIVALAGQTVKLMEAYAAERQVGLTLAMDNPGISSPLQLIADGKALQQVLINLIDNAVKHSPKGQMVTVGVGVRKTECGMRSKEGKAVGDSDLTKAAAYLVVWVEDHGEGIPAEEHERIFERFYRLGSELRRQTQGVGIGLSIVKHVVEAHGGRVEVRSEVGRGSRFTIELPLESETLKSETLNPKAE